MAAKKTDKKTPKKASSKTGKKTDKKTVQKNCPVICKKEDRKEAEAERLRLEKIRGEMEQIEKWRQEREIQEEVEGNNG